jgi:uncharacterized membrane protein
MATTPTDLTHRGQRPPGILEMVLIATTLLFVTVGFVYLTFLPDDSLWRPLVLIMAPVWLVIGSIITRNPHLVYATSAFCFMFGLITIFSIGIPIIVMGICLLGWYGVRSMRISPGGNRWEGVLAFKIWLFAFLGPLAGYLLLGSWL